MRVCVCVGKYAETPYCIPGLEIRVFYLEELCYCLKENAFLLDLSMMNDTLLDWLDRECGLREMAKILYPFVHRKGSLSAFVVKLLNYVGLYDEQQIAEVEQVLKQGAGLSSIEKKKSQIDYLVKKKKYAAAVRGYDALIEKWQEQSEEGKPMPAEECLATIWHNRGVALTGLMMYGKAAENFLKAFEIHESREFYRDYMAARRMELTESEYVSFAAEALDKYELTLELEKDVEQLVRDWEQSPEYLRLNAMKELQNGENRQRYYDESERITQILKESYRRSAAD